MGDGGDTDGGDAGDDGSATSQTAPRDNWLNQAFNLNVNRTAPAEAGNAAASAPDAGSGDAGAPDAGSDTFSDDPLAAGGFGPGDNTIRVQPGPVRTTLIRPKPDTTQDYQKGYADGASGGFGQCRVDATADEEAAYEKGYADGKAAHDAANQQYKSGDDALKALPPELQHPPNRDAPELPKWRDATKKWLETHHLDPGPASDSLQDLLKAPDDGTKLPSGQTGPQPDPDHYNAPAPSGAPPDQDDN